MNIALKLGVSKRLDLQANSGTLATCLEANALSQVFQRSMKANFACQLCQQSHVAIILQLAGC